MGPLIQIGANIFLIVENPPFDFKNSSILAKVLIPFPETPTFPTPLPEGIIHAKNSGYFF